MPIQNSGGLAVPGKKCLPATRAVTHTETVINKENVPESEMDEINRFIAEVDIMFERLDPPSPLMPDDEEEEKQEYMMKKRLIICFPNLNRKERKTILSLYPTACTLSSYLIEESELFVTYGPEIREKHIIPQMEYYAAKTEKMKSYGLRTKLSSVQERLLDRFIEIRPTIQW